MCGGGGEKRGFTEATKQAVEAVRQPAQQPAAQPAKQNENLKRRVGSRNILTSAQGIEQEAKTKKKNLLGA